MKYLGKSKLMTIYRKYNFSYCIQFQSVLLLDYMHLILPVSINTKKDILILVIVSLFCNTVQNVRLLCSRLADRLLALPFVESRILLCVQDTHCFLVQLHSRPSNLMQGAV